MFSIPIVLRFLMDLGAGETSKMWFSHERCAHFHSFRPPRLQSCFLRFSIRFFFDFCSQISPKFNQKSNQKKHHFFNRVFMILEQIWDPILEPCWPILAPCWLSWRLLGLLLAILGAILAPRCPPGAKWSLPDLHRPPFPSIFAYFFKHFRNIFIDLNFKLKAKRNSNFWYGGGFARAAHWIDFPIEYQSPNISAVATFLSNTK